MQQGITLISLTAILLLMAVACSDKDPGPVPCEIAGTDRFVVLLKEVNVRNTATPFYHFTYNDSGYVTRLSYHEDMYVYEYFYKSGRIDSVTSSSTDAKYFLYRYTNQRVSSVQQYDNAGLKITISIRYDDRGRVTHMDWQPVNNGPDEKHTVLTYYDDGNVKRVESSYPATAQVSISDFEAYDNKKCVDGFAVSRDFLEHVILLPQVRFQLNNPTRTKSVNGPFVREAQFNYVYHGNLPIERHSVTRVTAGPTAGDSYTGFTSFTYY
ncbi:hypothetical protein [Paraflavitalea speifideaquila]|uniref:hypothetical protein n=1 Tax=Paraflavitalea speifideaquila TaxID=3076558 RepID=UPI0028E8D34F|nr:hypothetical protein [Paraflavitalea speifideiaquila]